MLGAGNNPDTLLDMLELSLAQVSPLFDIVDLQDATWAQRKRYEEILTAYCSHVFVESHRKLAYLYANLGKLDDAMTHFNTLLRIDAGNADLQSEVGSILADRGQTNAAEKHFRGALRINPDHLSAHYNLGLALSQQQRIEAATPHLSRRLR